MTVSTPAMVRPKFYLFDADGTLRRTTVPGQPCPNKPGEWELIPGVKERLAEIDWNANACGVISNQAGVALGYMTHDTALGMLTETLIQATGMWCPFWPVLMCAHGASAGCRCRKPGKQLIWDAIHLVQRAGLSIPEQEVHERQPISYPDVIYVGDQLTDQAAAEEAGVPFQWAHEFFRWTPAAAGVTWEGRVYANGSDLFCRVMPEPVIWSDATGWLPAKGPLRDVILCAARAGRPFWGEGPVGP